MEENRGMDMEIRRRMSAAWINGKKCIGVLGGRNYYTSDAKGEDTEQRQDQHLIVYDA